MIWRGLEKKQLTEINWDVQINIDLKNGGQVEILIT